MGQFRFCDSTIQLDIAGHPFTIQDTAKYAQRIQQGGKALSEYAKKMSGDYDLDKATLFLCEEIDKLLGPGASGAIFSGREKDYFDALEVWQFIVSEFEAHHTARPAVRALGK